MGGILAECIDLAKLFHRRIQTELNSDWRQVYRDERHRPGYVIENGKPPLKLQPNDARNHPVLTSPVKAKQTR
jgi:hypothetical protein